jgi:hypothetical protein
LTGSTFGLLAILIGALFNARLNRQRDDAIREADRIAVASAIYAELQGVHQNFLANAAQLIEFFPDPKGDGGFWAPGPIIKIFPQMLSKIGLLDAETIRKVMKAYAITEQYLDDLIIYSGGAPADDRNSDRRRVYMKAEHADGVVKMNTIKAGVVKEAMEAVAAYLK